MAQRKNDPPRFTELTIHGFRRLFDVKLPMRPLCVMIGANGVGKTSVLDAVSLLAKSAEGRLAATLSGLSGLSSVMTYDRAKTLDLGISTAEGLRYSFSIRPKAHAYVIEDESLSGSGESKFRYISYQRNGNQVLRLRQEKTDSAQLGTRSARVGPLAGAEIVSRV